MSAVATNPQLQQCEAKTILSGSLLAESLGLAHSPQLGQYYLVPFKVKAKNGIPEHYDATFILGYKGYIQLAARSGNYKHVNVMEIKEGELVSYNPFDEDIVLNPIQDVDEREKAPTIGYYAMFEYINGFKKVMYWSKAQMLAHADRFSPAFSKAAYEKLGVNKKADAIAEYKKLMERYREISEEYPNAISVFEDLEPIVLTKDEMKALVEFENEHPDIAKKYFDLRRIIKI